MKRRKTTKIQHTTQYLTEGRAPKKGHAVPQQSKVVKDRLKRRRKNQMARSSRKRNRQ